MHPIQQVLPDFQEVIEITKAHLTCFEKMLIGGVQRKVTGIFPPIVLQTYLSTGICGMMTMIYSKMSPISHSDCVYAV
jgi:hypothetical protein